MAPGETGRTTLSIRAAHNIKHVPYYDVKMPAAALDIIRDNLEDSTPVSLTPRIKKRFPQVTAQQVHKAWTEMSEMLWKRAKDPMELAKKLLAEHSDNVEVLEIAMQPGVVQLAWVMKKIIKPLTGVVEIAMDSTCKSERKTQNTRYLIQSLSSQYKSRSS